MKRSDAPAELSRDHHQAVFVAQRLTRTTGETAEAACAAFESRVGVGALIRLG